MNQKRQIISIGEHQHKVKESGILGSNMVEAIFATYNNWNQIKILNRDASSGLT